MILSIPEGDYAPYFREMGCKLVPISFDRHGINPFKELELIFVYK